MRTPTNPDDFIVIVNISEINARNTSVFDQLEQLIDRKQYQIVLYDEAFSLEMAAKVPANILQECYAFYGRGRNLSIGGELLCKDFNNPALALAQFDARRFLYIGPPTKSGDMFNAHKNVKGGNRKLTARTPSALASQLRQLLEPKPKKKRKSRATKKAK